MLAFWRALESMTFLSFSRLSRVRERRRWSGFLPLAPSAGALPVCSIPRSEVRTLRIPSLGAPASGPGARAEVRDDNGAVWFRIITGFLSFAAIPLGEATSSAASAATK